MFQVNLSIFALHTVGESRALISTENHLHGHLERTPSRDLLICALQSTNARAQEVMTDSERQP